MEMFKTDSKKRIQKFQRENLVELLKYGYCQKTSCQFLHRKLLVANIVGKHSVKLAIILV